MREKLSSVDGCTYTSAAAKSLGLRIVVSGDYKTQIDAGDRWQPIALIEEGMPVLCVVPPHGRDQLRDKMISGIQEVRARGARTICLAEEGDETVAPFADFLVERFALRVRHAGAKLARHRYRFLRERYQRQIIANQKKKPTRNSAGISTSTTESAWSITSRFRCRRV